MKDLFNPTPEELLAFMEESDADVDAGRVVPGEQVLAELRARQAEYHAKWGNRLKEDARKTAVASKRR